MQKFNRIGEYHFQQMFIFKPNSFHLREAVARMREEQHDPRQYILFEEYKICRIKCVTRVLITEAGAR